ncbi:MAG: hypothetical protein ABI632_04335 [Pseudolysinimonas sp.]
MNDTPVSASAKDAQILLGAAQSGAEAGSSVSRSTAGAERAFAVAVGVCISLFLLSVVYLYPLGNAVLTVAVTLLYAAGLAAAIVVFARLRRGASAGWNRRYMIGFLATMVLYTGGVLIFSTTALTSPVLWVPYAIATAVPVILASMITSRR